MCLIFAGGYGGYGLGGYGRGNFLQFFLHNFKYKGSISWNIFAQVLATVTAVMVTDSDVDTVNFY